MSAAEGPDGLLDYRTDSDIAVVTVTGEVDVSTSGELRTGLLRVLTDEAYRGLVVNLANVNFIDSTGVGVLVGVWHRVRGTDDCLALAAPSRQARNILETTGLMKVLPVYDTEAEAVQACREPAVVAARPGAAPPRGRWSQEPDTTGETYVPACIAWSGSSTNGLQLSSAWAWAPGGVITILATVMLSMLPEVVGR